MTHEIPSQIKQRRLSLMSFARKISAIVFMGLLAALWNERSDGVVIANWNFNEKSPGATASAAENSIMDSTGNGHHLTAAGNPLPQYVVGAANFGSTSALKFTSGTDSLYTPQIDAFNFGTNDSFTIEAVLKIPPGSNFTGNIIGRDWGSKLPSWWFRVESGAPRFLIAQNGGPEPNVTSTISVNDGNWHHVAAVRDAANRKLRVYVDYMLAGETTDSTSLSLTNAQNLVVGAFNNDARQFEGEIDWIRISSTTLSPSDFVPGLLSIRNVFPTNGASFVSSTNQLRFAVYSDAGVEPNGIELFLNESNCSGGLAISGTPSQRNVTFQGIQPNTTYSAHVSVLDQQTNRADYDWHFDTYEGGSSQVFVSGEDGYNTYRIPALLVTKSGTLLAFCEARKNSASDSGDIDLALKRSFDNGKTWSSLQILWSDGANTIGNPCPVLDESNGTVWLPFCRNNDRVFLIKSEDDGATWSSPEEITGAVKSPSWNWYATGPGVGIQLKSDSHAGRLVIPCDHVASENGGNVWGSHIFFSDDHGETWQLGGTISPEMNECQVVELADGRLMMNMRNSNSSQETRAIATSADAGLTWSAITHNPALIEPICQASFLRYTRARGFDRNRLIFSNPASISSRNNLTVRLSYDEGQTWPVAKIIHAGPSAYSCLAVLHDMELGCLYEGGNSSPYETIAFSRFSLPWLTDGADKPNARAIQLQLQQTNLLLSWASALSNAVLESSSAPGFSGSWTNVPNPPSIVDESLQIVLPPVAEQRFFRLRWDEETGAKTISQSKTK
jgi:sialidase-1